MTEDYFYRRQALKDNGQSSRTSFFDAYCEYEWSKDIGDTRIEQERLESFMEVLKGNDVEVVQIDGKRVYRYLGKCMNERNASELDEQQTTY